MNALLISTVTRCLTLAGWREPRLWRYVTSELEKRPIVTWTEVDRYKLQLGTR